MPAPDTGPADDALTLAGASGGQRLFLAAGLLLFVVLCALPVVAIAWFAGAFFGSFGAAELLERTRGLAPDTYASAFRIAVVFTCVMVGFEVVRMLRGAASTRGWLVRLLTRPSTGLLFLFVPTALLVRVDLGGTDVPDRLTTTLLLCCLGYVYFILPVALLGASWRLVRWGWRSGRRSGFASGVLGTLGLAFASCVPLLCAGGEKPDDPDFKRLDEAFDRGAAELERGDFLPASRAFLAALAAAIPTPPERAQPTPPTANIDDRDRFDECIETLSRGGDGRSARDETIAYFIRLDTERGLAEQIVQDSLIELCLGHARVAVPDLKKKFRWLTHQRRKNAWRRQSTWDRCAIAVEPQYDLWSPPSPDDQADFLRVNQALCGFADPRDRQILELWALGHEFEEIGQMLDPPMREATVRQRKKRALEMLRGLLH